MLFAILNSVTYIYLYIIIFMLCFLLCLVYLQIYCPPPLDCWPTALGEWPYGRTLELTLKIFYY